MAGACRAFVLAVFPWLSCRSVLCSFPCPSFAHTSSFGCVCPSVVVVFDLIVVFFCHRCSSYCFAGFSFILPDLLRTRLARRFGVSGFHCHSAAFEGSGGSDTGVYSGCTITTLMRPCRANYTTYAENRMEGPTMDQEVNVASVVSIAAQTTPVSSSSRYREAVTTGIQQMDHHRPPTVPPPAGSPPPLLAPAASSTPPPFSGATPVLQLANRRFHHARHFSQHGTFLPMTPFKLYQLWAGPTQPVDRSIDQYMLKRYGTCQPQQRFSKPGAPHHRGRD